MTVLRAAGRPVHARTARAVAAFGLVGSMLDLPTSPLADSDWQALQITAAHQRITGFVHAAICSGALPVTTSQREQAQNLHIRALGSALMLERLLLEVVDSLEQAGVPARVLKGSAVAHLDYPDTSLRTFGDIDVLVPSEGFDTAVAALVAAGHRRRFPQPRPGFDRRYSKGTSFRSADGFEIDLHRTFTMGPFGLRLSLSRLWERHAEFELAGRTLRALAAEERFLHACYHAVLGDVQPRLVPLRDTAQILLTRTLDTDRIWQLMSESGGEAVVARAVRLAWSEFELADVVKLSAWADAYRDSPRASADFAVYGGESTYAAKSAAALRALPSLADKAQFLRALIAPDRDYVTARHGSAIWRLASGAGQIRRARRLP
ncbi:MAG: nucleotidyltransferase family protein [Actinomycetes bacterium]